MTNETGAHAQTAQAKPPQTRKKPHSETHHGITISDDYHWLRDPGYPEVTDTEILAHLEAENNWFRSHMDPHQPLIDTLFAEMKGRIKEADRSVPVKDGDWLYWVEFEEGAQYLKHYRRPHDAPEGESVALILDEAALATGKDYFRLGASSVSPDGTLLAYAIDDDGSERFTVRVKNLITGEHLPDTIPGTLSALIWTSDSKAFVYSLANAQWRTDNARLHRLGDDPSQDVELYHEEDEGFRVSLGLTAQEDWIVIATGDHETNEARIVPADNPTAKPIIIAPRKKGHEYDIDIRDGIIYVLTNDAHINFRIATASLDTPDQWQELIAGSDEYYITGLELFRDFYVVEGRRNGLDQIVLHDYSDPAKTVPITFPEASYVASTGNNPEYICERLRLSYESMVSPATVFDYHVASGELETLKVQEIPSGYDPALYTTERRMVTARDGTQIPVSIMKRADRDASTQPQLHLYGYGAYGITIDPGFSTSRLSLVDRGFAYAIAHIRGGDDMGRQWYLDGKLQARTNTFNDFVDVARALVDGGLTRAGTISISGGSAGGELMGAVVNSDPDLWGAVVAHVPFVDVLNTMLDASLPLTPGEWPEWGNPIEDKNAFTLIQSYSPYDQVRTQDYPPIMVTAGLNDPRVTYWEPAKWVAKLREHKTDDNLLILKTNMGAGHGGKSGRWESLKETAEEFAFILWQMGMRQVGPDLLRGQM